MITLLYILQCKPWPLSLFLFRSLLFLPEAIGFGWKHGMFGHGNISALSPETHPDYWAMVHAPWGMQHISVGSLCAITNTHANMAGDSCWEYIWTSLVSAPGELHRAILAQSLPPKDRLDANTLGVGTCGQLMCVTESGAHTGLVHCASANFISYTKSALRTSAVVIESPLKGYSKGYESINWLGDCRNTCTILEFLSLGCIIDTFVSQCCK